MDQEGVLPLYHLHGTDFYVDVHKLLLREIADQDNKLFIRDMDDNGKFYEFDYNKKQKCIVDWDFHISDDAADIVNASLPPLGQLDPKGMAQKYGYDVDQIKGMSDREIVENQPGLKRRLSGFLPEIELLPGHIFYVDWKHRCLILKDELENGILYFDNMVKTTDETAYLCAFHIPSKKEYKFPVHATEKPKEVVILEIPYELKLDPVAVSIEHKVDVYKTVRVFPVQKELKAEIVSATPMLITRFKELNPKKVEKEQRQGQEKKQEIRPRLR